MFKKRRRKWIAPIVLAGFLSSNVVSAAPSESNVTVKSVDFVGMSAPFTALEMASLYSNASIRVVYSDGSIRTFPISYEKLFRTTDFIGGTAAGVAVDAKGKPIMDTSIPYNPVEFVSDSPDSNSLLKVEGAAATSKGGNPLSLLTHYEYITFNQSGKSAYGIIPASVGLTTLDQNKTTGKLTPMAVQKVDFSGVGGLWIPCNGSLTPWNTHLSSEEYEPDARAYELDPTQTFVGPFVKSYTQNEQAVGNPYAFGWIPEITVNKDSTTTVVKHYSLGRFSHELGKVAPDQKTVFFGDDGGNTMLFLYVAEKAQDLSAGTLYAAKWIQTSAENGGAANLKWIKLGQGTDAELKTYVDKGIKFSDIFEIAEKDTSGFTKIKSYPSGKIEWLKVKPGMEKAAAFLESRRYAAMLGATSEFNKMEGVTFNIKDNKVYIAMANVEKAMEKDTKGTEPTDDIQVNKIRAGVTYELSLQGDQLDMTSGKINSSYVPVSMKGLIVGEDLKTADWRGNMAADDKVANPDNIDYSEELRTIFIGEDSGMHANNYVWAYNIDTKQLSRILSLPAGAEATGLQNVDNLNGFRYIMSNFQHPGDEMILPSKLKTEVEALINLVWDQKKSGAVGYMSGLPTAAQMLEWKETDKSLSPLRATAEAAGATVEWNDEDRSVTVRKGSNTMIVKLGEKSAKVNGQVVSFALPIKLEDEKMFVPTATLKKFLQN